MKGMVELDAYLQSRKKDPEKKNPNDLLSKLTELIGTLSEISNSLSQVVNDEPDEPDESSDDVKEE